LKAAKGIADSVAIILATCGTQEEPSKLIQGTQTALECSREMLVNVKGSLKLTDAAHGATLLDTARNTLQCTASFLDSAKLQRKQPTAESQQKTSENNEEVVKMIGELVEACKVLPGSEEALKLFQQSDELEQLAEKELMAAASTIEEAARTLLEAKKRQLAARKNQDSPLPEEEITEAILDAARAITTATGTLVASATAAQKELVEKGRVSRQQSVYRRDPAWAKGLISAAQSVAGTVKDLVAAANSAAQGKAEEEVLVASAKGVAASTARLVYASRTKADPFSPAQKNLSSAAKSVAAATQSLVQAAKSATQLQEDEEAKPDWSNQTQQRKAEMEAQMKILKLQKELDKERFRLGEIRKNEYKDANVNVAGEQASSVLSSPASSSTSQAPRTTPVRALPKSPSSGQSPSNASLAPTKKSSRPLKPSYTLEELQAKPPELDQESLEQYLSDDDFQKLFGIDKKTFLKFPAWKRTSEKKRYGLY